MSLSLLRATIRPDITSDMGAHQFCYMILPHKGSAADAGVNNISLEYNVPLVKSDCVWGMPTFEPLYLQAAKFSEDGLMKVIRPSEQNGSRGVIISYSPFEIITIGVE